MKKKKKHAITKRKKEFRLHKTPFINKQGKKKQMWHPAFVFQEKGNIFVYISITHSSNVKERIVVKLRKNPNPEDERDAYRVVEICEDTKDRFGKRLKGWKIDIEDEQEILNEYKKLDKRIQEKSLKHTKITTTYRKFEKSIIIYLVSKQTPVVSIPNKQHRSLRQEATAATL